MSNCSNQYRRTVFLDTNVVHYMAHYLSLAREHQPQLPPFAGGLDDAGLLQHMETVRRFPKRKAEFMRMGWRALGYLQGEVRAGAKVMISVLTPAEFSRGLLEGRAQLALYEAGICYRLRQQLSESDADVQDLLTRRDFSESRKGVRRALDDMERVIGGPLESASPRDNDDVLRVISLLQAVVYLDLPDSVIYASALLQEADELLTEDAWLARVAGSIEDPDSVRDGGAQKSYWRHVQKHIKRQLASALLITGLRGFSVTLPKAKRAKDLAPQVPY